MPDRLRQHTARRPGQPFRRGRECLIVHCCHHRAGTNWFLNVLSAVAEAFDLPLVTDIQAPDYAAPGIVLDDHSHLDPDRIPVAFRGSHLRRDPRDMVVSGYHYHLWCNEPWAVTPLCELGEGIRDYWSLLPVDDFWHLSYQQYLNSLDSEQGIDAEIRRCSTTDIGDMARWNYADPRFLEVRYEDLIGDEPAGFRAIFRHYGFSRAAVRKSVDLALGLSFENLTRRRIGEAAPGQHLRSAAPRQWEAAFSADHRRLFKQLHGQDLIRLGYESNLDW